MSGFKNGDTFGESVYLNGSWVSADAYVEKEKVTGRQIDEQLAEMEAELEKLEEKTSWLDKLLGYKREANKLIQADTQLEKFSLEMDSKDNKRAGDWHVGNDGDLHHPKQNPETTGRPEGAWEHGRGDDRKTYYISDEGKVEEYRPEQAPPTNEDSTPPEDEEPNGGKWWWQ